MVTLSCFMIRVSFSLAERLYNNMSTQFLIFSLLDSRSTVYAMRTSYSTAILCISVWKNVSSAWQGWIGLDHQSRKLLPTRRRLNTASTHRLGRLLMLSLWSHSQAWRRMNLAHSTAYSRHCINRILPMQFDVLLT